MEKEEIIPGIKDFVKRVAIRLRNLRKGTAKSITCWECGGLPTYHEKTKDGWQCGICGAINLK